MTALFDQLRARLIEQAPRLPLTAAPGLSSLILALPRAPATLPPGQGAQFQFIRTHGHRVQAGYGIAAQWQASGEQRLQQLAAVARTWQRQWTRLDVDDSGFDAVAMLGFAASGHALDAEPLPNALLWIPEVALIAEEDHAALVFTAQHPADRAQLLTRWLTQLESLVPWLDEPIIGLRLATEPQRESALPDQSEWNRLVLSALEQIAAGTFAKVVLSRRLTVRSSHRFDIPRLLGALNCLFPSCQIVNLRYNGSNLIAATPERLCRLQGAQLEVDAIAGTAPRGETPDCDAVLTRELLASDKNQREHRFVVEAIRQAIADCCATPLQIPVAPQIMQLSNAQHLWSPMQSTLSATVDLFDLAERLHPTPATNGQPRDAARDWLQQVEPFSRGWYTGAAGILTPDLSGELWVLLRCAQISADRAELYAGSGLVAGSDPADEWEETEAKLGAMLTALQFA